MMTLYSSAGEICPRTIGGAWDYYHRWQRGFLVGSGGVERQQLP